MEGGNVSLSIDCEDPAILPLRRGMQPIVSVDGATLLAARRPDEDVFEVGKIVQKSQMLSLIISCTSNCRQRVYQSVR